MEQSAQAKKFILNYGLIFGLLSVVLGVIMYVTDSYLQPHWAYSIISYALFIVMITLGVKAFKTENGGFLSIGEAIKVGIGIALIGGIITALWSLLLSQVLVPDFMEQSVAMQRETMIENAPEMSQQQIDDMIEMSAPFQSPWLTIPISLVINLFFGLIVSLIVGVIMRQKRPYEV